MMKATRTPHVNVRSADTRRAFLESHVFELLLAALGVLAALGFFFEPGELAHTAIGQAAHPFDYAWNVLYAAGGALVVAGLVRPSYRLEVAGLVMFGAAVIGAGVALVAYRGHNGLASFAIYLATGGACFVRIYVIRAVEAALAEAHGELEALQAPREGRR